MMLLRSLFALTLLLFVSASVASTVHAALLSIDEANEFLISVDPATSSGTQMSPHFSIGFDGASLTYDPSNDVLSGLGNSGGPDLLLTVDRTTGNAAATGNVGPPFDLTSAFHFDSSTNILYGLIQRNNARANGGVGLRLSASTAYRENVVNNNVGGTVVSGVNLFSNSCNGTTACP